MLELSGLPAHSYSESRKQKIFEQSKSDEIRRQRIAHIQQQIAEHPPRFVVIIGAASENIGLILRDGLFAK